MKQSINDVLAHVVFCSMQYFFLQHYMSIAKYCYCERVCRCSFRKIVISICNQESLLVLVDRERFFTEEEGASK